LAQPTLQSQILLTLIFALRAAAIIASSAVASGAFSRPL
jgi:K+ transporter